MSVPNQTPYNIYTANGLSTVFAYEFYLISASDIQVTINGSEVSSGYTVSGVGNTRGGEVTFLTAPANGATVIFERVTPTYRLTDYQDNGDLLADTVNKDFDRLWMAIQRAFIYLGVALSRPLFGGGPFDANGYRIANLADPVDDQDAATKKFVLNNDKENFSKTLRVPEVSISPLPGVFSRKNKILAFNSIGDPIAVLPESGSAADILIELGSSDGTKLIVAPGTGGTLYDWISGQYRSLFYYLSPAKIASVIAGTSTDVTEELQAAMDDSIPIWMPAGQYYVTDSITASANSSLEGPGPRLASIDNRSSSHAFIIGAGGYLRGWKLWKGFSITASGDNTADSYAFYYSDRQDANGAPVYTIGQIFSEIEINSYGKLGGGWFLQDCFRVVIRDCGGTGLSQPFRLVGSVVQTTIDNFVQNGDGAASMTGRSYTYGLTTEKKTYGNGSIFTPEGLTVVNTRFVKQDIGVRVEGGLYLIFDAVEADYSKYKGFWYDGGSQVSFDNCYVGVQSYRDADFVGFDIPARAAGVAEAVNVQGCTVNMSVNTHESAALYKSLGVRVGDSSVGQKGALIDGCTFRGDGYDAGIYVYRGSSVSINNNRFQYSGVNISVAECTNLVMIGNSGNGAGKYILNSSSTVATWTVLNNTESFESVTNVNPGGLVAKNPGYSSATLRRIERVSSPVNVSVAAGAVYQHAAPATIPLAASVEVGGAIPAGLLFSAAPASTSLIRATFFNPTSATITLSTTLYFDITHPN
ncbi:phage tail fiber domain-containing protein [Klebsiella pneumoniae]|uniref:phage tail fiber domain-containing protein n=1 Tax=Klebsiella pneumoniae TaxID=573 RepID=UPI000E2D4C8B|nr:phage tail fiber protein [Klebsiella pneumoniae]SWB94130.1 Phage T7 tail fibre protein [Klebsiella pneumoniae]